jgi:hypothetical protein
MKLYIVLTLALTTLPLAVACGGSASDQGQQGDEDDLTKAKKCGGIAGLTCPSGYQCVDDPTDSCDPAKGGADCIGICKKSSTPTVTHCGGFAGLTCPAGQECVDDPSDSCDPAKGGADCSGICQPKKGQACGGFAGLTCPKGQTCVDDPSDSCDPKKGGADCIGICK